MIAMGKVYGEITLRYWADPDAYAKLYGSPIAPERALKDVASVIPEIVDADFADDDPDVTWRGAEVVARVKLPGAVVMSDQVRQELMVKYNEWRAERSVIGHREENPGDDPIDSDDWYHSDSGAVDLYGDLAAMLFGVDDCGHQEVTTTGDAGRYVVQCDNCPSSWVVKDGEVVAED